MGDGIVKARYLVCIFVSLALIMPSSAADVEGGVNVEPVIEDTIFESLNHTVNTTDLDCLLYTSPSPRDA